MTAIYRPGPTAQRSDDDPVFIQAVEILREHLHYFKAKKKWGSVSVEIAVQDGRPHIVYDTCKASSTKNKA